MKDMMKQLWVAALVMGVVAVGYGEPPGMGPGPSGAMYATDAYPGFDNTEESVKPERKEPRWFSFIFGPNRKEASDQYAYCQELVAAEDWSKACRQLDALVREWPTAPEAWKAQQQLAEILLVKRGDAEEAFAEYRYLLDFYSLQCDYNAIADKLREVADIMKFEGKEVMFIRFANTVDVRRAYETCIMRAPGAAWVPEAMLTVAGLREDEGKYTEAVKVYENLRNIHPDTEEAKTAVLREANVRMLILREREYNRARTQDTVDYMRMALRVCRPGDAATIQEHLAAAQQLIEDEAYREAKFYDSKTRTKRSAVSAYEKFLEEHPQSGRADEVRARIEALKGEGK